jgi:hypothetical protein
VLPALVAVGALVFVLVSHASRRHAGAARPPAVGLARSRACVTTSAEGHALARSAIVVDARASAPIRVSEQASGPGGIVTVTRSEQVTAGVRVEQPVEVSQAAGARARACADGRSVTAARTAALRAAYLRALALARGLAGSLARHSLAAALRSQYPLVAAAARRRAELRAHELALAAGAALATQAQALARQRAGD